MMNSTVKWYCALSISIIFSIIFIAPLSAGEDGYAAGEEGYVLKIATMDLPPYGWVDDNAVKRGIIFEMTQEVGMRMGLPFEHNIYPFNRMLMMMKEGKVDILSSQAHQNALDAGEKIGIQFKIDVIAATKKGAGIKDISDFKGKNLIYHRGASYNQLEGVPKDITYAWSYEASVQMLHRRNAWSGAVFSEPAYYYFMGKLNLTPKDFGEVIYVERNKEQWIFARRGLPDHVKESLKKVVNDIYSEGMYEKLLNKYGKYEALSH